MIDWYEFLPFEASAGEAQSTQMTPASSFEIEPLRWLSALQADATAEIARGERDSDMLLQEISCLDMLEAKAEESSLTPVNSDETCLEGMMMISAKSEPVASTPKKSNLYRRKTTPPLSPPGMPANIAERIETERVKRKPDASNGGEQQKRMKKVRTLSSEWTSEEEACLLHTAHRFANHELKDISAVTKICGLNRSCRAIDKKLRRLMKFKNWRQRNISETRFLLEHLVKDRPPLSPEQQQRLELVQEAIEYENLKTLESRF